MAARSSARNHAAGRVLRRVEHHHFGAAREQALEAIQVEGEAAALFQRHRHRSGAAEADHRFVDREAGIGVDDLVAGLEQGQHGEEDDGLAAGDDARRAAGRPKCRGCARCARRWPRAVRVGPAWGRSGSSPRRAPSLAASTTCGGVGKSGSPISRWITLRPCASSARARTRTSKADSMPMRDILSASFIGALSDQPQLNRKHLSLGVLPRYSAVEECRRRAGGRMTKGNTIRFPIHVLRFSSVMVNRNSWKPPLARR